MLFKENNKEQWEQLSFVLQERDKPTLIVIGFDSYATRKNVFSDLRKEFFQYKFYELDLSSLSIVSLHQIFITKLPKTVLNSKPSEYIVNVFGLENSIFQNQKIERNSLIAELNFEREILFQRFPFITIIWSDSYSVNKLKKEAKDLWDWISYHFEFKTDNEMKYGSDDKLHKTKVFISYAREDFEIAKKLYDDLKKHDFQPWLDSKEISPGDNWIMAVSKAIKESSFFLALISLNSINKKGYTQQELKFALDIADQLPMNTIFIMPVYLEYCNNIPYRLMNIQGVNLYDSYEEGLNEILRSLYYTNKKEKYEEGLNEILRSLYYTNKKEKISLEHFELNKELLSERINRIDILNARYDSIKLDDTSRERLIKERLNIQKLLGKEYMELKDYEKAEQSFRIALALAQQVGVPEYENEISFLLRQIYFQKPI